MTYRDFGGFDIKDILQEAHNNRKYKNIDTEKSLVVLDRLQYGVVYSELMYKNTMSFIDDNDNLNLIIKFGNMLDIERIVKGKTDVQVERLDNKIVVDIQIGGTNIGGNFIYDLSNSQHLYFIKRLIESGDIILHFVAMNVGEYIKCISILLRIEKKIMERIIYIVQLAANTVYPEIEYKSTAKTKSFYLEVPEIYTGLESVIMCTDALEKWGSRDAFNVYVLYDESLKIYFSGDISNTSYIKQEIGKKCTIMSEGFEDYSGKPFLKYDNGMIFFYK